MVMNSEIGAGYRLVRITSATIEVSRKRLLSALRMLGIGLASQ